MPTLEDARDLVTLSSGDLAATDLFYVYDESTGGPRAVPFSDLQAAFGVGSFATVAECNTGTSTTLTVNPAGLPMRKVGTAWIGGDLTGNTRGAGALDLQSARSSVALVASGANASAFGKNATASGAGASAMGYGPQAIGDDSVSIGTASTAGAASAVAVGSGAAASGASSVCVGANSRSALSESTAIGTGTWAKGASSAAIGHEVFSGIDKVMEIGYWDSSARVSAFILHGATGQVSQTVISSATALTDAQESEAVTITQAAGVATVTLAGHGYSVGSQVTISGATQEGYNVGAATILSVGTDTFTYSVDSGTVSPATGSPVCTADLGQERDGRLARGMGSLRYNSDSLYFDVNVAGTIKTFPIVIAGA